MMHSYYKTTISKKDIVSVLILVVMDDALVLQGGSFRLPDYLIVLILVVMDDALVLFFILFINSFKPSS